MDDGKYMALMYEFFMDRTAYKKAAEMIFLMLEVTENSDDSVTLGNTFYTEVLVSDEAAMKKAKWTYEDALNSKKNFDRIVSK